MLEGEFDPQRKIPECQGSILNLPPSPNPPISTIFFQNLMSFIFQIVTYWWKMELSMTKSLLKLTSKASFLKKKYIKEIFILEADKKEKKNLTFTQHT